MSLEGEALKHIAFANADWLKTHLTPEFLEAAKAAGLIDEEKKEDGETDIGLLSKCQNPESYISISNVEKRAHADQLIESLKEFAEAN